MFKLEEERSWSRKWQCKTELTVTRFEMQVPRRGTAMFGLRDDHLTHKVVYSTRPVLHPKDYIQQQLDPVNVKSFIITLVIVVIVASLTSRQTLQSST